MASNRGHVYQHPDPAAPAAGGAAPAAAAPIAGSPAASAPVSAFKDAASARGFLKDYVNDEGVLNAVGDDKVIPWAGHVKTKVDGFGKQFPEGWRQLVAGENAEHLKTLERFQSPKALYDSYAALRSKMSSGELKAVTPFPDKGTADQQTAWRAENNIPIEATGEKGYQVKLENGVVLGEQDKVVVEELKKHAHATHMSPGHFQSVVDFYLGDKERQAEVRRDSDAAFKQSSEDALRAEWGPDYRSNVNRIGGFLDTAPKGVKDLIVGARLSNGKPLGSHPDVLKWLADLARQSNPAGVTIPGSGGTMATSIEDEIGKIEKFMREDRPAYNRDEKKQARLRELYGAREQMKARKAA